MINEGIDLPEMDRQIYGLTEVLMNPNLHNVPIHARQGLNEKLIAMVAERKKFHENGLAPYMPEPAPETQYVEPLFIDEYKTKDQLMEKLSELDDRLKTHERPFPEQKRQAILEQRTELISKHKQMVDAENLQLV